MDIIPLLTCPHGSAFSVAGTSLTRIEGLTVAFPCGCNARGIAGIIRSPKPRSPFERVVKQVNFAAKA